MSTIGTTIGLRCSTAKGNTRQRPASAQSRDKVKDLLINKMMKKYGKLPNAKLVISSRVSKFIQQSRLTDANLKLLEKEIVVALNPAKETKAPPKPAAAVPEPSAKREERLPDKSNEYVVKSIKKITPEDDLDLDDDPFARRSDKIEYNEDKDWDAIQKFNAELYIEEIQQEEEKKRRKKSYVKTELDKQLEEKKKIEARGKEEYTAYSSMEKTNLDFLTNKERDKEEMMKKRKLTEKERLDRQLREDLLRKRTQELENKQYEKQLVERNKKELEEEKLSQIQKREIERNYHKKMIEENEANKKKQSQQLDQLREQDKKDLVDYAKMLEQQEADRLEEVKSRERKTQDLMNRMADTVLKEIDRKRASDDQKVVQYQREKEIRDKLDDEERLLRVKEHQQEMRLYLDRQTSEKKEKVVSEKKDSLKEAQSLRKELEMHTEEEKMIKQKVFSANREHAEYLQRQMTNSRQGKKTVMNREEYLLNRQLISSIENRPKTKQG